jgi:YHS domain-containing protein
MLPLRNPFKKETGGETMVVQDIVCHLNMDKNKVIVRSVYKGKTYHFCCFFCKERFDREPEKYLQETEGA